MYLPCSLAASAYWAALYACLWKLNGEFLITTLTSLGYFFKISLTKIAASAQCGHWKSVNSVIVIFAFGLPNTTDSNTSMSSEIFWSNVLSLLLLLVDFEKLNKIKQIITSIEKKYKYL